MAGLDGVKRKIDPSKEGFGPYDFNLYKLTPEEQAKIKQLPRNLDQALDALQADQQFLLEGDVFPQRLIDIWVANRRAEAAAYNQMPQPIEFSLYYDL
jgi:glutamine synthetase